MSLKRWQITLPRDSTTIGVWVPQPSCVLAKFCQPCIAFADGKKPSFEPTPAQKGRFTAGLHVLAHDAPRAEPPTSMPPHGPDCANTPKPAKISLASHISRYVSPPPIE